MYSKNIFFCILTFIICYFAYDWQIVSCIIDPLLQEVNETASRLPTVDMAVYLLNCMHQIQSTLALYEYMDQRLERLQVIG